MSGAIHFAGTRIIISNAEDCDVLLPLPLARADLHLWYKCHFVTTTVSDD